MELLILGGTVFLGRHLVVAAMTRGHEVTLFNRGRHHPGLFPELKKLRGDRDGDLDALQGQKWDAVIDTCGYLPSVVAQSADLLAGAVGRYVFISSISAYADASETRINEDSPLAVPETRTEAITGATYGPLKAACEQMVKRWFPGRSLMIRPGLIVGPHDPTDRFTYWPVRLYRGGDVLAPAPKSAPVQIIDVRDLSEWIIHLVEEGASGPFNATGPAYRLTMAGMLERCREAIGSKARLHWLPADYLLNADVEPWSDLPLWLVGKETAGLLTTDISRAIAAGLTFRPLGETALATLKWAQGRPADYKWRAGLSAEREITLLANRP